MSEQDKIALSKMVAELYGIEAWIDTECRHSIEHKLLFLADDSAGCFELAVKYNLDILNYKFGYVSIDSEHLLDYIDEPISDYQTKAEATRIAILKCLVKVKQNFTTGE